MLTKPVSTITPPQVAPHIGMGTGQKQIGLLASVGSDKTGPDKPVIVGIQGQIQTVITGLSPSVTQVTPGVQHNAEVCAVQGPPRQLTTISPSPSPTSSTSSSPRPNSVNSMNFITNLSSQDTNANLLAKTQSPATVTTTIVTQTSNVAGQSGQLTTVQRNGTNHITISTSTIVNNQILTQVSQASGQNTTGTIVVAGTVRQFTTVDHQIRVLTPSEIMRTLPSLSQEHYDPPPTAIIHTVPVQTPAMVSQPHTVASSVLYFCRLFFC